MSVKENKAIWRYLSEEGLNKHNIAVFDECFAPDLVAHPDSGTAPGYAGYRQSIVDFFAAFPDAMEHAEDLIGEGDRVVLRFVLRGTHKGHYFGVPPTGKLITMTGIEIFRFADKKIAEIWMSPDSLGILKQLGAYP